MSENVTMEIDVRPPPGSPIIEFTKVSKIYPPDVIALRDITFSVRSGEMLYLTGMSGSGKTTLLKLICAIERPTRGVVEVAGHDLAAVKPAEMQAIRQHIGMAYQDFRLLPRKTVAQNIAMPMEVTYLPGKTIRDRINYLLDALNLTAKRDIFTDKLSRGEQQRVAIARACANYPPIILADEPTGNLDPENTRLVVNLFKQLHKAGTTLLIATHDLSIIEPGDQVLDIHHGRLKNEAAAQPAPAATARSQP